MDSITDLMMKPPQQIYPKTSHGPCEAHIRATNQAELTKTVSIRLSLCGPNAVPRRIRASADVADAPNSPDGLQCPSLCDMHYW